MKRKFVTQFSEWSGKGILSILGPTGVGKSKLLQNYLADKKIEPLIVSVDAAALYQGLDIGSAKPSPKERGQHEWAGLDLFSPNEKASVAVFVKHTKNKIIKALECERPIILIGGSHFYEKALSEGMGPGEASDPSYLESLSEKSNIQLWEKLNIQDTRWGSQIHPHDRYRLLRFSDLCFRQKLSFDEIFLGTKNSLSSEITTFIYGAEYIREELLEKLSKRVDEMFKHGWLEEVEGLVAKGYRAADPGLCTLGYAEIMQFRQGQLSTFQNLKDKIILGHIQLAKKQRTWLRGLRKRNNMKVNIPIGT